MEIKTNHFDGKILEFKEIQRNGVPVGIVAGYIATWDIDRGNDQFQKGAFSEHLEEYRKLGRQIRLKDSHGRTVGGFPIESVKEDEKGLYGVGEVNLELQQGRELMSLVKQQVITDFSVGYRVQEKEYKNNIRVIKKAQVFEGSIVDEPMNTRANILSFKSVNSDAGELPLLDDRMYKWDAGKADNRVRQWAKATETPNEKYKKAFLWYDEDDEENFEAYKLQIGDIIDGELKAIPRAVVAVRAALSGARGGVDIPPEDKTKIQSIINSFYEKMGMEKSFDEIGNSRQFTLNEIKCLTTSNLSYVMRNCELSKDAADYCAISTWERVCQEKSGKEISGGLDSLINEMKKLKM